MFELHNAEVSGPAQAEGALLKSDPDRTRKFGGNRHFWVKEGTFVTYEQSYLICRILVRGWRGGDRLTGR